MVYGKQPSSDEAVAAIRYACKLFDEGAKGYLSRQDVKMAFLFLMGFKPSKVSYLWN